MSAASLDHLPSLRQRGSTVLTEQLGLKQVHGLEEGLLLAQGELVKDAGNRRSNAVKPFTDHDALIGSLP